MKPEKRKRLEAAGWKVGTVREFLDLTDEETALIELKLDLARAVKAERICRKLTQDELGRMLGSSQSRVAKMESGDPSVSVDLLLRSILAVGASANEVARALGSRKKLIPV